MKELRLGVYEHFKGRLYEVIGIGNHSENLEQLVVYRSLYDSDDFPKGHIWISPEERFFDEVEVNGKKVPRFRYVGDK